MPGRKIVDETEVRRWIEREGRTYEWMAAEYQRKYGLRVTPTMFSNYRARHGLQRRIVRDPDLMPWHVLPRHRHQYQAKMLRVAARHKAGKPLTETDAARLDAWLKELAVLDRVVDYDPEVGFRYVRRDPRVDDADALIRQPPEPTTTRKPVD